MDLQFYSELLEFLLKIAVPCSAMAIALLQVIKTKGMISDSRIFGLFAIVFNFGFSVLYTLYFSNLDVIAGLWVGVFITVGVDNVYKALENKNLLKSISDSKPKPIPKPPIVSEKPKDEPKEENQVRMFKLALDAGHGLPTPGRRTLNGVQEWTLNNAVLLKVAELAKPYAIEIKRFDDVTGKTDKPLMDRISEANKWGGDFFYSRHHNGFTEEEATGVEIYHPFSNAEEIAKLMVAKESEYTGLTNRGAKTKQYPGKPAGTSYFAVNRETNMPGVLGEGGFMTTTKDMEIIESEQGQYASARAIVESLVEYYNIPML